ncbi:hypothetical protein AB0I28_07330 [Phytomonospora sp. NPDC050363]|uniref:hypothetical protein n=1 Tax=Phytomonospora sp. NPDC050363 TaxID=3155642 RepID=UPI0033D2D65C
MARHPRTGKESRPLRLRYGWHVVTWLCTGIVVTAAVAVLLWLAFGSPDLRGPVEGAQRFDVVKLILTVAGSVTGGVGAVVALVVSYRRQHQSEAAERREDTRLFNERYHQAAEQLGSDKAAVRMAGVYALSGLADDWDGGRAKCVEVLCAYMRMPYAPPGPDDEEDVEVRRENRRRNEERQVRRAILDTIAERLRHEPGEQTWHGRSFDLRGAVIDGAELDGMRLRGAVLRFDGATFRAGEFRLRRTSMEGGAIHLTGATFGPGGKVLIAADGRGDVFAEDLRLTGGALKVTGATVHTGEDPAPREQPTSSPPAPREAAE